MKQSFQLYEVEIMETVPMSVSQVRYGLDYRSLSTGTIKLLQHEDLSRQLPNHKLRDTITEESFFGVKFQGNEARALKDIFKAVLMANDIDKDSIVVDEETNSGYTWTWIRDRSQCIMFYIYYSHWNLISGDNSAIVIGLSVSGSNLHHIPRSISCFTNMTFLDVTNVPLDTEDFNYIYLLSLRQKFGLGITTGTYGFTVYVDNAPVRHTGELKNILEIFAEKEKFLWKGGLKFSPSMSLFLFYLWERQKLKREIKEYLDFYGYELQGSIDTTYQIQGHSLLVYEDLSLKFQNRKVPILTVFLDKDITFRLDENITAKKLTSIIDNTWFIKEPHKSVKNVEYIYRLKKDLLTNGLVFIKDFKTRQTYVIKAKKFLELCSNKDAAIWDLTKNNKDIFRIEEADIGIMLNDGN